MIYQSISKIWLVILLLVFIQVAGACSTKKFDEVETEHVNISTTSLLTKTDTHNGAPTTRSIPTNTPGVTRESIPVSTDTPESKPSPTSTSTLLSCWVEGGVIQREGISTEFLKDQLEYRIYLPPCYDQQMDRRYPVLYLFHGQGFTDEQWDRIGVDEKADALIAEYEIPPLIIVMPHEIGSDQPTGSKFARAIIENLIPYIDKTYRTLPNRSNRAIGGLSRGGGWAVHFGISEWKLFGAIGAHSPGVFRADDLYLRRWLEAIPQNSYPRIYIDIGDRDLPEIYESAIWLEQMLNTKDIPHEWHFFTGYHNEDYWRAHLESYLRWYTQNW